MNWDFTFPAGTSCLPLRHGRIFSAPRDATPAGPVVLFVHGGFHGAWNWAPAMRFLAAHNVSTAAIDLRGHGGLPQNDAFIAAGVREMSEDLAEAATALGGDVVLAGHSLGALIAMSAARAIRPRGLAVLAPAPPANIPKTHGLPPFPDDIAIAPPPEVRARKWFLQGLAAGDDLSPYIARLCAESPALLNDRYRERVHVDPAWIGGPRLCLSGMLDVSPLHGAGDDQAVADFLQAEFERVGGGHCFMIEDTAGAERLLAWLTRHNLIRAA